MDKQVYLGDQSCPQPLFRSEAGDVSNWPAEAVMAVTFDRERFSSVAVWALEGQSFTEFFGSDGWPLDLPAVRRASLPVEMRRQFQIFPWGWRAWSERDWSRAHTCPRAFEISRRQSSSVRPLVAAMKTLHPA